MKTKDGDRVFQIKVEDYQKKLQNLQNETEKAKKRNQALLDSWKSATERLSKLQTSEQVLARAKVSNKKAATHVQHNYWKMVQACYPEWNQSRKKKLIRSLQQMDKELSTIQRRQQNESRDFEEERQLRESLIEKVTKIKFPLKLQRKELRLAQERAQKEALFRDMQRGQLNYQEEKIKEMIQDVITRTRNKWNHFQKDVLDKDTAAKLEQMNSN